MFPQDLIRDFPDLCIGTGFPLGASIRFVDIITYLMVKELFPERHDRGREGVETEALFWAFARHPF